MHQFKDNAPTPRLWTLSLNIGTVKRVKALLPHVDLLDLTATSGTEQPLAVRLMADPILICDVLYVLVKPEADKLDVSDEDFAASMGGGAIFEAQSALMGELTDFFRQLGRTETVEMIRQAGILTQTTIGEATRRLGTIDMEKLASQAVGKSFTDAQALLDKTLTPTPSAN